MGRPKSNRGLRFLLILTVAAVLGALVQDFRVDSWIARERESAASLGRDVHAIEVGLANLRAAQASYVATGQGPGFWMTRGIELAASIDSTIERLRSSTTSAEARAHYDAAAAFLGNLNAADRKARDYVATDQRFLASDTIFMDGLDASQHLTGEIGAAADAERLQSDARLTRYDRIRTVTNLATLVWGMFVVLVVYARLGATSPESPAEAATPGLSLAAPPVKTPSDESSVRPADTLPGMNLPEIAELCGDLARVLDGRDVPALLERTVKVLGAKGAVLWVIDTSGTFLRPLLLHGYPEKVVRRLGTLQVDADNMTSLAFRSLKAQTISGSSPDAFGAIAVPLVTGTGCVGVLAAELQRTRSDNDTLSAAKMIAAQLAALAAPAAQGSSGKTAQG